MASKKILGKRDLTELEGIVLSLVGAKGPCTPYFIRKEFKLSPSPYWRGSAGTIYPIFERLEEQNLIDHVLVTSSSRGAKLYSLTDIGKKAVKVWLYQPTSPMVTGTPPDALRVRVEFLAFLTPNRRRKFLEAVLIELENQLAIFRRDCDETKGKDVFAYVSSLGGVLNAQIRLDWIRQAIIILDKRNKFSE